MRPLEIVLLVALFAVLAIWLRPRRFFAVLAAVVWAAALFLGTLMPVFDYAASTGPYAVGTARLFFTDQSREDPLAPNPHALRELLVVVWYPADQSANLQPEQFWPDAYATGPVLARIIHLPPIPLLRHLQFVKSHSYPGAPVSPARARYPVLVFSHGYGGTPWQNTVQMEHLASHGFVIFSIGHTFESAAIPFPDGRVQTMNLPLLRSIMDDRSNREMIRERLDTWVADTRYVVDRLATIGHVALGGRLDLTRLGVFGMSFGGATAGEFCAHDARCKAGMNMDGKQHGTLQEHPLSVPFLYFAHEGGHDNGSVYAASRAALYGIEVRRSEHANFMDLNLVMPMLKYAGLLGKVDPRRMEEIMNAYTLEFFKKYLEDKSSPLLDGQPPLFPEVSFRARRAGQ